MQLAPPTAVAKATPVGWHTVVAVVKQLWPVLKLGARRRAVEFLVVAAAVLLFSRSARQGLATWLSDALRSGFGIFTIVERLTKPKVRKDFLSGAVAAAPQPYRSSNDWSQSTTSQPPVRGDGTFFAEYAGALPEWLSEAMQREGYSKMKPIQKAVLPLALRGSDVVGIAPTGSGKTLAFVIPAIVHITGQTAPRRITDGPIALVLAPTRELVTQIESVADSLLCGSSRNGYRGGRSGSSDSGIKSLALYGGTSRQGNLQALKQQQQTHLFVATPGRLLDFVRSNAFSLKLVSFFVLDEGDRMLDFGFQEDIQAISAAIRQDRQMLFFSATWPPEVEQAALQLCGRRSSFERVTVASPGDQASSAADGESNGQKSSGIQGLALPPRDIKQNVEVVRSNWSDDGMQDKIPLLLRTLEAALGTDWSKPPPGKALIFVKTRRAAEELGQTVADYFGLERCGVMHGLRRQEQREATLKAFRDGRLSALVATDVLGRGVDIPGVTHVVIFDFPDDIETYVHRVGRTGRNGNPGESIAFFEPRPWQPDLAIELAQVLQACGQEVPQQLMYEVNRYQGGPSGGLPWASTAQPSDQAKTYQQKDAPPLEEKGNPELAADDELGHWSADGARAWSYSANGGLSEQGRLELRTGGLLRTTWGWGDWTLVEAPSHQPLAPADAGAGMGNIASTSEKVEPRPCLSLSWSGITDVVALTGDGKTFELVSRDGRPANTIKKTTVGKALPGIVL